METKNNVTSINQDRSFIITSERNDATLKMEWGISPPKAKPIAWGARAIFKRTTHAVDVDYVWDRSAMVGGTELEREAFAKWINKEAVPLIREHVKSEDIYPRDSTQVELPWKGFTIVFSPKASCGYLYIGIWPSEGLLEASKETARKRPPEAPAVAGVTRPGLASAKPRLVGDGTGTVASWPGEAGGGIVEEKLPKKRKKEKKPFFAVIIKPGRMPEVKDIGDAKLETLQGLVDGYVERANFFPQLRYSVWVNEDGVLRGLPFNMSRVINRKMADHPGNRHHLYGTIVLSKDKGMTREEAEQIAKEWAR